MNDKKRRIKKQNRVIAALKADSGIDSDKDYTESNSVEKKLNKKVKFNVGVTQRKNTDQE